jgi:hypothetical protein
VVERVTNSAENKCFLCCSAAEKGIHLFNNFICSECEKKIVNSSGSEKSYGDYVEKIKQILSEALSCQVANI